MFQRQKSVYEFKGGLSEQPLHMRGYGESSHGHLVLPLSLLTMAIKKMHEPNHCSRAHVLKKLQAVWWSPDMNAMVDRE